MKILLVHQNYPAQFLHLAPELIRRGHEVTAQASEAQEDRIARFSPGVNDRSSRTLRGLR